MLVLGRREGERIIIGEGPGRIVVTLVRSGLHGAQVGVEAPEHVPIVREELLEEPWKRSLAYRATGGPVEIDVDNTTVAGAAADP